MADPSSDSIFSRRTLSWLVLAVLATLPVVSAADPPPTDTGKLEAAQEEFFEAKVRPVLADNCLECHGAEKHKGGLRLDVRAAMLKGGETGPAVVPGKPEESPLIEAIRYEGDVQMPPKRKAQGRGDRRPDRLGQARRILARATSRTRSSIGDDPCLDHHRSDPHHRCVRRRIRSFWSFQPGSESRHRRRSKTARGRVRRSTGSSWPSSRRTGWRQRRRPTKRP